MSSLSNIEANLLSQEPTVSITVVQVRKINKKFDAKCGSL